MSVNIVKADKRSDIISFFKEKGEPGLADIYCRSYENLYHCGLRSGFSSEHVEDIIQQMFLEFAEKKISFENVHKIEAFVLTCFRRKLIDYHRSASRNVNKAYPSWVTDIYISQQDILEEKEEIYTRELKLKKAFDLLPSQCKTIIYYKYTLGLTNEEIVLKTGLSIQTVYNTLYRAIKALRKDVSDSNT